MRLVKMMISNFRSIGGDENNPGVIIDFDDVNIIFLVGQNNVGKSSILKAYEYFVLSGINALEDDFHKVTTKSKNKEIIIEAWIKGECQDDFEHPAMKTSMCKETQIAKFRKVWEVKNASAQKYTYDTVKSNWKKGGGGGLDTLLQNACPEPIWLKGLDSSEIILENVQKLIKEKVMSRAIDFPRFKKIKEELEELRKDIISDDYVSKVEKRLTELMQETFSEMSVSLFGSEKEDLGKKLTNFISTDINITNSSCSVNMDNHGHGLRRQFLFNTLRGLSDIFKELNNTKAKRNEELIENIDQIQVLNKKRKMLLIEEPELFLHPQSVRLFADILYNLGDDSEFQIMAATHSPILVDLSRDHTTIIRTIMTKSQTKIHQVKYNIFEAEEKERMKMLNSFNPYVCEAFFSDFVILVEGDTESIIYREIIKRMITEGIIKIQDVPLVVNCGSKMNIPSFQKVLRHFGISYFVIHDLDDTFNSNGNINAAWTLNERIYDEITEFNKLGKEKARRFIMERNFESAHNYEYNTTIGKPLSAYKLVHSWNIQDKTISAIKAIDFCLNYDERNENFDQTWVEARVSKKS